MNGGRFPPSSSDQKTIRYEESVGLRQRKQYSEALDHPHVFDNWNYDVLRHCLPDDYDEERRLLYVSITRAKHHVIFAGGEEPNSFLESLPVDIETGATDVSPVERGQTTQTQLPFTVAPPDGPRKITPHDLMDESVFDDDEIDMEQEGGGTGFGSDVHEFAEEYARDSDVSASNDHERHIKQFIDGLEGEKRVEEPARLPMEVDGQRVTISGVVDLVHLTDSTIEIIDFKTDASRRAEDEYRKQVSVYYHVLNSVYPDREVTASLYYSGPGERVSLTPLGYPKLREVVELVLRD